MNRFQTYLLSVLAAAMLCAVLKQLFHQKNSVSAVVHLLAGVFLAVTMLRPLLSVSFASVGRELTRYSEAAALTVEDGKSRAGANLETIIKERVQAYILEQAQYLHVEIAVDVRLSGGDLPVPVEITVRGAVSPYARSYLSDRIAQDIGVPEEKQIWIT